MEKALKHIQEWEGRIHNKEGEPVGTLLGKTVREIHVPTCAKCDGPVVPRRVEQPEEVPHGLSLGAMARMTKGDGPKGDPVGSLAWQVKASLAEREACKQRVEANRAS